MKTVVEVKRPSKIPLLIAIINFIIMFAIISSTIYQNIANRIDRSCDRLRDASYLIYDDVYNPLYLNAFHDVEEQIKKHPEIFKRRCDAGVITDLLLASDVIERTNYLSDFRSRYTMEYAVAYLDYYEDEYLKIMEAYFEQKGVFHPQYIEY